MNATGLEFLSRCLDLPTSKTWHQLSDDERQIFFLLCEENSPLPSANGIPGIWFNVYMKGKKCRNAK